MEAGSAAGRRLQKSRRKIVVAGRRGGHGVGEVVRSQMAL